MTRINTYPDILKTYFLNHVEIFNSYITTKMFCYRIKMTFNNQEMINTLTKAMDDYLINVYQELKILKFLLKNERKLYFTPIMDILDQIEDNFATRAEYYDNIFKNLETAIEMKLDYKFYIPRKYYENMTDEDVEKYISYAKGFNAYRIREFLEDEKVLNVDDFDEAYEDAKIVSGNIQDNLDFIGVFDRGMILPEITNAKTTLINIHEFIHWTLLRYKDVLEADDDIINSEDLPIFYELLFKKYNCFVDTDVHTTPKALELLKTYKEESLKSQIAKLKKIK